MEPSGWGDRVRGLLHVTLWKRNQTGEVGRLFQTDKKKSFINPEMWGYNTSQVWRKGRMQEKLVEKGACMALPVSGPQKISQTSLTALLTQRQASLQPSWASTPVVLLRHGFLLWTGQQQKGIPLCYSETQDNSTCDFDRDPLYETELPQGHDNQQPPVVGLSLHYNLAPVGETNSIMPSRQQGPQFT